MTAAKTSRVTNVQVPGEEPAAVAQPPVAAVETKSADLPEVAKIEPAAVDLEALRAHIREEERAIIHAELADQIKIASSVIDGSASATPRSKSDYRRMRSSDVDPTKLTAPVLTLDGWVCPPAPEAKK